MSSGVCFIAVGPKAELETRLAREYVTLPVFTQVTSIPGMSDKQSSRLHKTTIPAWSPFDYTLYCDADTRIYGDVTPGFDALASGFDLALAPSTNQGDGAFWHIAHSEKDATISELGYTPVQWQCGVMFIARNERTARLFAMWNYEWKRYRDEDQAAFVRALHNAPVKIFALGYPWNGGAVIGHRFGACRAR